MIHEILSNSNWINPQIDYLLFLQNIRDQFGGGQFFMSLTRFGEFLISTLLMSIIYWCVDFKSGLYLITLNVFNLLMAQILKLSACVYRPWILCNDVHPVETAMKTASGYSFPSGHTAIASIWGGCAYLLRKNVFVSALFVILVLLIAFSRNYVGVHTPQDVVVALVIMFITVFWVDKILLWCEKNNNRYLYVLIIIDLAIALATIYVLLKSYPINYVKGEILVNPKNAVYGALINAGWISGLINGALICARFNPINTKICLRAKVVRAILGLALFSPAYWFLEKYIYHFNGQSFVSGFFAPFMTGLLVSGIYPYIFTKFNKLKN